MWKISRSSAYFPPPRIASTSAPTSSMNSNSHPGAFASLNLRWTLVVRNVIAPSITMTRPRPASWVRKPKISPRAPAGSAIERMRSLVSMPAGICSDGWALHRPFFGKPWKRKTVPRARRRTRSAKSLSSCSEVKNPMGSLPLRSGQRRQPDVRFGDASREVHRPPVGGQLGRANNVAIHGKDLPHRFAFLIDEIERFASGDEQQASAIGQPDRPLPVVRQVLVGAGAEGVHDDAAIEGADHPGDTPAVRRQRVWPERQGILRQGIGVLFVPAPVGVEQVDHSPAVAERSA